MFKKWMTLTLTVLLSTAALTACTDDEKIKDSVAQSLAKQKEIKAYRFGGSAEISISDSLLGSTQPLTNGLLSLIRESTVEWSGAVDTETTQFEADLKITPKGAASGIAIPALIKDNKLYFNIPAISKAEEYYVVDMAQMNKNSQSPLTPESMKNTSQLSSTISSLIVSSLDAKWFKEAKEPLTLKDGTTAKKISIEVTKKNEKDITAAFQSKLPEAIRLLQTNGFVSSQQADKWLNGPLNRLQIHNPGTISLAFDDQGFVRDQLMDISFSVTADNGNSTHNQIKLHQSFDGLNQPPVFSKKVPEKVKSFDEVLKLLGKSNTSKK